MKGLSPGDVLEYSVRCRIAKPLIPGQFWAEYNFERNESVMKETLEISVPAAREIKFKNRGPAYVLATEGDRRIYRWTHSNPTPKNKDDEASATWKLVRGRKDPPDVLLSSFKSWDELGRWYESLQQERVKPSPEIAAKAAVLGRAHAPGELCGRKRSTSD